MELAAVSRETLAWVAAVALAVVVLQALWGWGKRGLRRRHLTVRMERAADGERRAAGWLQERGFLILGSQVAVEHEVRVDDRSVKIALRADYLVERGSARYVVEVKTGALAPRIETSATRRQLLEYRVAFDADGVLLVDAETGAVHEVTFPSLARSPAEPPQRSWALVTVLVLAGAAVGLVMLVRNG